MSLKDKIRSFIFGDKPEEKEEEKTIEEMLIDFENYWKAQNDEIRKEYNAFYCPENEVLGMTRKELKELHPNIIESPIVKKITLEDKDICPTCGGKLKNGICSYCGNKYDNDNEIQILYYKCKYGEKTYKFNKGILTEININAKPLEDFLFEDDFTSFLKDLDH